MSMGPRVNSTDKPAAATLIWIGPPHTVRGPGTRERGTRQLRADPLCLWLCKQRGDEINLLIKFDVRLAEPLSAPTPPACVLWLKSSKGAEGIIEWKRGALWSGWTKWAKQIGINWFLLFLLQKIQKQRDRELCSDKKEIGKYRMLFATREA